MALFSKSRSFSFHYKISSVLEVMSVQFTSGASSIEAKPVRISKNLSFRPATDSKLDSSRRPIVLVYGWLVAKSQHIHKYGDFYLGRGYDVLHVKVEPLQLLWPRRAQTVVSQIVDFVNEDTRSRQPIVVHGFSVGGYLYGETLVKIVSDMARLDAMKKRVKGQIFDSPVDLEGVPRGVGMALSEVPFIQKSIKFFLDSYLSIFYNQVTQHYKRASDTFYANPLRSPSFVFHSRSDKIAIPGPIENLLKWWKDQDIPVNSICWNDSPHVGHFRRYPVEYITALKSFLESIGLAEEKSERSQNSSEIVTDKYSSDGVRKISAVGGQDRNN